MGYMFYPAILQYAFADDLALILKAIWKNLREVHALFQRWQRASALGVNGGHQSTRICTGSVGG